MNDLYPEILPRRYDFLEISSGHKIYFEECGNPEGIPVVFLHGGPGSGCNENHRRYFNPDKYKIVLMDQRGCGRSTPQGNIESNTTHDILSDIEAIRQQLSIKQWLLFAGSWGSTLALLYAEQYPKAVSAMVLRGSFLARKEDLNWFLKDGVAKIFPDYWDEFCHVFPSGKIETSPIKTMAEAIFSDDRERVLQASIAWATWAGRIVTSSITNDYELLIDNKEKLINETRIEMHYAMNNYFISDNQILDNVHNIPDIPIRIIHGRKDLTCLPESSWLLHKALPKSKLTILADTGHLAGESAMIDALIETTDELAELL